MKVCRKCGALKEKSEFHTLMDSDGKRRHSNGCILCVGKEKMATEKENREILKKESVTKELKTTPPIFIRASIISKNGTHTVKAMIKNGLRNHEYKKQFDTFLKARNHEEVINENPSVAEKLLGDSKPIRYKKDFKVG